MIRIGNILMALLVFQSYAYGAIPPPPAGDEPETAVSEDVADVPPATETEANPDDVIVDEPKGRPTSDPTSTNTPPKDWYKDMYKQLYGMQQYASHIQDSYYSPEMSYYASYLYYVLDQVYSKSYVSYDQPKKYAWGYPTRGDFNHAYYYWIRPLYKKMMYHSAQYYSTLDPYYYAGYKSEFQPFYNGYHSLSRCMFGRDGNDLQAEDDTAWAKLEAKAGLK